MNSNCDIIIIGTGAGGGALARHLAPSSSFIERISPWAVVASLPFEPKVVLKTIRHAIEKLDLKKHSNYGIDASFNPTFPSKGDNAKGRISPWQLGLNQGPIIIMIENFQSGLIWNTIKKCPYIIDGLKRAGFSGGWLGA